MQRAVKISRVLLKRRQITYIRWHCQSVHKSVGRILNNSWLLQANAFLSVSGGMSLSRFAHTEGGQTTLSEIRDFDPALAKKMIDEEEGILIDCRTLQEFQTGAPEAAILIPYNEIAARIDEVP